MKTLYKYIEDKSYEEFDQAKKLVLKTFLVTKETPCGYWVREHGSYGKNKFVLKGDGKRFAHETIELALKSFIARKKRQIWINKRMIAIAKHSLKIAESMNNQPNTENI